MRNPQRSQQEWRQLFKQQQHSGLSAVEFCIRPVIPPSL